MVISSGQDVSFPMRYIVQARNPYTTRIWCDNSLGCEKNFHSSSISPLAHIHYIST